MIGRSVWKYSPRPGWMTTRVTGSGFRSWFDTGSGRRWWITGDWRVLIEITCQTKAAGMCTPSADGFFVGQRPAWLDTFAIKTGNGISWRWAWNITYWLGFLNANGQFQGNLLISYLSQFTDGKSHSDKSKTFEKPECKTILFWIQDYICN